MYKRTKLSLLLLCFFVCLPISADTLLKRSLLDEISFVEINESLKPNDFCTENPILSQQIIDVGTRLGVQLVSGQPLLAKKDATYEALHGSLGIIVVSPRYMSPSVRCQLITHEFIHVLQHIKGGLKAVIPMDWPIPSNAILRFGSLQEAEAYIYQNKAALVLKYLLFIERNILDN